MTNTKISVELSDGALKVSPWFPVELPKELTYYRRSMERDKYGRPRMQGFYHDLHSVETLDSGSRLVTMPGFLNRVLAVLERNGAEYSVSDSRTPFVAADLDAACEGLRDYQYPAVLETVTSRGGIVACPTGWGKGRLLAGIAKAFGNDKLKLRGTPLTVIAAPDKDIVRKNYAEMRELLPGRDVGILMSGISPRLTDDVMVCTLDSLHRLDPDDVGVLVVDEVHSAGAAARAESISNCVKAVCWGVSATPDGRFDGGDLILEGLFGPVIFRRDYSDGVACGALVPIEVWWVKAPQPDCGMDYYFRRKVRNTKTRHGIVCNTARNRAIAEVLLRIPDRMQTLVIMKQTRHLDNIYDYVNVKDVPYVHGCTDAKAMAAKAYRHVAEVPRDVRTRLYSEFESGRVRKIMSTHVYKQGVNFPELGVIVVAGEGGAKIASQQIPGRGSRSIAGKDKAYLIEFWHDWDFELVQGSGINPRKKYGPLHSDDRAKSRIYKKMGFEQFWVDSVDDIGFLRGGQECRGQLDLPGLNGKA